MTIILSAEPDDFVGDEAERDHGINAAELDGFGGHTKDDTTGFVLGDSEGSGLFQFEHPAGAIVTHAGHYDSQCVLAGVTGGGPEEHIDRRAMAANQGPVLDVDVIAGAAAFQQEVFIAGSDEHLTANDGIAVGGFLDLTRQS